MSDYSDVPVYMFGARNNLANVSAFNAYITPTKRDDGSLRTLAFSKSDLERMLAAMAERRAAYDAAQAEFAAAFAANAALA